MRSMKATVATVGLLLALSMANRAAAEGVPLAANQEVPEMMMELQGQIFTWLGTDFGPSEPVSFTSTTDIANKTFSFSSVVGATYGGQRATIAGSGVFNTSTLAWDLSASGNVLGESWSLSGTAIDPPPIYDIMIDIPIPTPRKVIASVEFTITDNVLLSFGVTEVRNALTDAIISQAVYADARVLDGPNKGDWNWNSSAFPTPNGNRAISSAGFSPDEGGAGSFTVAVVPEPGTMGLLAVGMAAALVTRRGDRMLKPRNLDLIQTNSVEI